MQLLGARIVGIAPFADLHLPISDEDGAPRAMTVLHGAGGMGKTTVLAALAATRPGCAVVPQGVASLASDPYVVCDYKLGDDDPDRPHPLRVATPTVKLGGDEKAELLRRREQAHFEKVAKQGGFAFLVLSSRRWFSRGPLSLTAPLRSVARYDVRAIPPLDDAARADLTRETKQALAYAGLAAALAAAREPAPEGFWLFEEAMTSAVGALVALAGYSYRGLDVASFEPIFIDDAGKLKRLEMLPERVRHLVALGALPVRTLWAAYPGRDPRQSEGVIAIDEVELHQDASAQARLAETLRRALPRAQWILTTSSPHVASSVDVREVLALRPTAEGDEEIELHQGELARLH